MIEAAAVNAHTHIYSGLVPFGMPAPQTEPKNFVEILQRVWWRLDRALDESSLRASARWYVADALLSGTSFLVDHHESPSMIEGSLDVLADACSELGIRALLCFGATERNGGRPEAKRGLQECRRFIESNSRPEIAGAVGLHASFTVSDETIADAVSMARELGCVVHVHVAEDAADVADAQKRGFRGPLERLMAFGGLPAGSILAHAVHLTEAQISLVNEAGLWLVQNPRSNRGNRVGYPYAIRRAARVALGTDGYPSNMREEQAALCSEAAAHEDVTADLPRRTSGGRLLAENIFGSFDDAATWDGEALQSMTVAGREVVRSCGLASADLEEIRAEAEEQAARLWKRMAADF